MRLRYLLIGFAIAMLMACKKDSKTSSESALVTLIEKQDSIYFIFVNKIGFRKDSVYLGNGENKVFVSVILKSGYYNIKTNKSEIYNAAYNRGETGTKNALRDSIMQIAYPAFINSQFNLIVTLVWQKWKGTTADVIRELKFQTNTNGNDTIQTFGNKFIKFTWPDDTVSGRFTKTYDGP